MNEDSVTAIGSTRLNARPRAPDPLGRSVIVDHLSNREIGGPNMGDSENPKIRLGRAIRQLRRKLNLTQEDLGVAVQKSKATISKIEAGSHNLDSDTIDAIAACMKTTRFQLEWEAEKLRLEKEPANKQAIMLMDDLLRRLDLKESDFSV